MHNMSRCLPTAIDWRRQHWTNAFELLQRIPWRVKNFLEFSLKGCSYRLVWPCEGVLALCWLIRGFVVHDSQCAFKVECCARRQCRGDFESWLANIKWSFPDFWDNLFRIARNECGYQRFEVTTNSSAKLPMIIHRQCHF